MKADVNGIGITTGTIARYRYGGWRADVEIENGTELSGPVIVTVGRLSLSGEVVPSKSGVSASIGKYLIRGGLSWDTEIKPRSYHSDAGVRLYTVLRDVAKEIGQESKIILPPDRVLGNHYVRAGTMDLPSVSSQGEIMARDVLTRLSPHWWVDNSNTVHCGDRIGAEVNASRVVLRRNMTSRLRVIGTEEAEAFEPGSVFEGDVIGSVVIQLTKRGITLALWGST